MKADDDTAAFVNRARTTLDLTQADFAAAVGVERRSIIRYEQGGFLPQTVRLAIKQLLTEHRSAQRRRATR